MAYNYIQDLNDYIQNDKSAKNDIKITLDTLKNIYETLYEITENEDSKLLNTDFDCPHCNNKLLISDLIDYSYFGKKWDENFYDFEVDKSKNLDSKQTKKYTIIAMENNVNEKKEIETDENFFKALDKARKYFKDNINNEVYISDNENNLCYCKSSSEECFYDGYSKINLVSKDILNEYIKCWDEGKKTPIVSNRLYCVDGDFFVAVDNIGGNCWTEEFNNEVDALKWLFEEEINKNDDKGDEINAI